MCGSSNSNLTPESTNWRHIHGTHGGPRFTDKKARLKNAAPLVAILDPLFASQPLPYWKKVLDDARPAPP
jgi:hypothetical protein